MKKIHKATYTTARSAFTLAELLVGILVVSVILTLLAPVITKRAKESISINGGGAGAGTVKSKLFIYNESDPDCTQAAGSTNVLDCTFTAPQGVNRVNAVAVSAGGGGAGATQPTIETGKRLTVANTTVGSSRTQEITITNNMKNILISQLIGSGAGGGGATWAESSGGPQSQSDCDPFNALFIPAEYNGSGGKNTCVTKYNVGDSGGPTIASSVSTVMTGGQYCSLSECCWKGTTSQECTETGSWDGHTTSYSGCTRTVCTWQAAKNSCQTWAPAGTYAGEWRLPTNEEMKGWANNISKISPFLGSDGLQLCEYDYPYFGSVRCYHCRNCYGAGNNNCYPYYLWTSSSGYFYYLCGSKLLGPYNYDTTRYAHSARCVYDGVNAGSSGLQKYNVLSGGGGGAGAYIKNYQIPSDIVSSNIGGKIVLYSAAGGAGGSSASSSGSSASNGSNGNTSYIEVYSSDNVLKWGIRASGGYAGEGASSSSYGEGGAERTIASCQLYENGSWRSVNCTGIGAKGLDGTKVENASSTNTATGGTGGGSMYNTTVAQGGGSGGSTSGANGYSGSVYGAGGGGATIVFDSSNNAVRGTGGRGANGVAEITYDIIRQAAGGGAGGGGAFVRADKIKVISGKEYIVKVASGGAAGSVASSGADGGVSSVTFEGVTYTLSGGKGGSIGTSATDSDDVIQGIGGLGGIVSSNVSDTSDVEYKNGLKGDDANTYTTDSGFIVSNGGNGGTSGLDTKGGCGGLFIDSTICTNTNVNAAYVNFTAPNQIYDTAQYGAAGAGGGGGGWSEDTFNYPNSGGGSQGQSGYVYINWVKYKN